jgi:competence protein CoiA
MIFALNEQNNRILAEPNINAICPVCKEKLIAKCGKIKVWHFAHIADSECDSFAEHESQWHIDWKNKFPRDNQEVVIEKDGIKHIADIYSGTCVIELQHSPISPDEIHERENFYGDMIWVFDLTDKYLKKQLTYTRKSFTYLNDPDKHLVYWKMKWGSKCLEHVTAPLFLDIGSEIIQVSKIDDKAALLTQEHIKPSAYIMSGTGYIRTYEFIAKGMV